MKKFFYMCLSGHFHSQVHCPYDGSKSDFTEIVERALDEARRQRLDLSVETLVSLGVPRAALKWAMVVEFGSSEVAFDAMAPASTEVRGTLKPQLGLDGEEGSVVSQAKR
ncbi:hypothetical protein [Polyangium sp. y55x31]|uniref:hypothetical protein n=1 Tax=Polyangium sp. y55x31 TaxID=3042688 RepID=UPI002482320F|nr:hypothetical protein [Polyangium sp. y55x31]MDI1484767.1 hypothetical protein [Polyangium sp. y55x31]